MRVMFNSAPPLQQAARDLAVTTRLLMPVMEIVRKHGGVVSITEIAPKVGADEDDVRRALFALEAVGLVESSHYRVTGEGRRVC